MPIPMSRFLLPSASAPPPPPVVALSVIGVGDVIGNTKLTDTVRFPVVDGVKVKVYDEAPTIGILLADKVSPPTDETGYAIPVYLAIDVDAEDGIPIVYVIGLPTVPLEEPVRVAAGIV